MATSRRVSGDLGCYMWEKIQEDLKNIKTLVKGHGRYYQIRAWWCQSSSLALVSIGTPATDAPDGWRFKTREFRLDTEWAVFKTRQLEKIIRQIRYQARKKEKARNKRLREAKK